jgi:hypothetical protein
MTSESEPKVWCGHMIRFEKFQEMAAKTGFISKGHTEPDLHGYIQLTNEEWDSFWKLFKESTESQT